MKRPIQLVAVFMLAAGAPAAENDVLLPIRTANGGQRTLTLPLTPGTAILGGTANLPGVVDIATQVELDAINLGINAATAVELALKAPLASPTFTGVPAAPTAAPGTNTTQIATTAFVTAASAVQDAAIALKAPLASPALTGTPTAPTATLGTSTTQIATTAFTDAALSLRGVVVDTDAEFTAALLVGGNIFIKGDIVRTAPATISVAETQIYSIPTAGVQAKVRWPYTVGQDHDVFVVAAENVGIHGLEITTGHPLTTGAGDTDCGIRLSDDVGVDVSGLVIDGCNLHDLWQCITRAGAQGANSEILERGRITNNHIHGWHNGIYIDWNTDGLLIDNNTVRGIDPGQTHTTSGNCIWLGNQSNYTIASRNRCSDANGDHGHGIELVLSTVLPGTANGNLNFQAINNRITNVVFGISFCGNGRLLASENEILGAKGIAIEAVNNAVSLGEYAITNNSIVDTVTHTGQTTPTTAISANGLLKGVIQGNTITRVTSPGVEDSIGIQFFAGARNLLVTGNTFTDAGSRALYINGETTFALAATAATDLITDTAHGLVAGNPVVFPSLTGGAGLSAGSTIYYVIASGLTADDFKVSTTVGGAAVDITTDGTGIWARFAYSGLTIDGNAFHYTAAYVAAHAGSIAISAQNTGVVAIRKNTSWYPTGTTGHGLMQLDGVGTVYSGDTGTAAITAPGTIAETNIRIPY